MSVTQELLMADISDYQNAYLARRYKRAGRRVVMIKAGDGLSTAGAKHHGSRADASHNVGLVVVHYLMAVFDDPARECVDAFLERIYPHWLACDKMLIDVEDYSGSPERAISWLAEAQDWLRVHHHWPRAMGYTNEAYLIEGGAKLAAQAPWWLVAIYNGTLFAGGPPKVPGRNRGKLLGKQYTDGQVGAQPHMSPGIGPCDDSILTHAGLAYLTGHKPLKPLRRRHMPPRC